MEYVELLLLIGGVFGVGMWMMYVTDRLIRLESSAAVANARLLQLLDKLWCEKYGKTK